MSVLKVNTTEVVDENGNISWDRIKNKPTIPANCASTGAPTGTYSVTTIVSGTGGSGIVNSVSITSMTINSNNTASFNMTLTRNCDCGNW